MTLLIACDRPDIARPTPPAQTPAKTPAEAPPAAYLLDSQPFSPTLAHLFDQGRIVVLPEGAGPGSEVKGEGEPYAFSALDRYGRIYHFDRGGRWWMGNGRAMPAVLPEAQWDAAWNPATQSLEVLVTAPWAGDASFVLYRWGLEGWVRVQTQSPPPARQNARRLLLSESQKWLVVGGRQAAARLNEGWLLDGTQWRPWDGVQIQGAPDLSGTIRLIDAATSGVLAVVHESGDLWLKGKAGWQRGGRIDPKGLMLTRFLPDIGQALMVWNRGLGEDKVLLHELKPTGDDLMAKAVELTQTSLVKVNEEDEGLWRGWGRVVRKTKKGTEEEEIFEKGIEGPGDVAFQISGEYAEGAFTRDKVNMIELPPRLETLRPRAAAWVPALGGLVVPSADGLGLNVRHEAFYPARMADRATSAGETKLDVVERTYRLWVFQGDLLEWIKPPFEIHPAIGYPNEYRMSDGRRRTLGWTFPEPGLFRYEYQEISGEKRQWIHSPLLTLRQAAGIEWKPGEDLVLLDPVVVGDPAELILVGWCGRLGEVVEYAKTGNTPGQEVYTSVPDRGFMARISALNPQEWKVSPLPIPFCEGGRLVVAPARGEVFLLGGKVVSPQKEESGRMDYYRISNRSVWMWDGKTWERIDPEGDRPKMKVTSNVAYDPASGSLLALTPITLYSFEVNRWRELWKRTKEQAVDWPEEVGLYVHPLSNLTLGVWFLPEALPRVWSGTDWLPVGLMTSVKTQENGAWRTIVRITDLEPGKEHRVVQPHEGLPERDQNVISALAPDAFVSIDATALAQLRMDVPRDRSKDRLLAAHWLQLIPAREKTGWVKADTASATSTLIRPPAGMDHFTTATTHSMTATPSQATTPSLAATPEPVHQTEPTSPSQPAALSNDQPATAPMENQKPEAESAKADDTETLDIGGEPTKSDLQHKSANVHKKVLKRSKK